MNHASAFDHGFVLGFIVGILLAILLAILIKWIAYDFSETPEPVLTTCQEQSYELAPPEERQ